MTFPLPALTDLDSRGRRILLRALAGASRRNKDTDIGNHPDHDGDDAATQARCPACQEERDEKTRRQHGVNAKERIKISRRLESDLAFLAKCIDVIAKRRVADERDTAIERELKKWHGEVGYVARRTGFPITAVRRVAKRMKDGGAPLALRRASLSVEYLRELNERSRRPSRSDTRERAFELFETGDLRTIDIARTLGVTSSRI